MSSFPSSQLGLPNQLNYSLPPSLSDSARSYSVNVAPDGATSVVGPAFGSVYVNESPGYFRPFTSQQISFTIPVEVYLLCNIYSLFIKTNISIILCSIPNTKTYSQRIINDYYRLIY